MKENAALDEWAIDLAPSEKLTNWFDHNPYYWEAFRKKYKIEWSQNKQVTIFLERHMNRKIITLLYSTTYDKLTHALVIKEFLETRYHAV